MTWIKDVTEGTPDNVNSWVRIPDQSVQVGSPWTLVTDRFDKTAHFAETAFGYTTDYIQALEDILKELELYEVPDIEVDVPEIADIAITTRPLMSDLDIDLDDWPANTADKPVLDALPEVSNIDIPGMDINAPDYLVVAPPEDYDIEVPTSPGSGPALFIPAEPDYIIPEPPVLDAIFVPPPPVIDIPVFEASLIQEEIPVPASFSWHESPYNSDIWKPFLDKVLDGIINGGTGLAPEVEQMIFDRAKYRQLLENDKAYREVEQYFSARGYDLPPGAMVARLAEISVEILKANTDLNEKIAIEQAQLAQKNTHFMLEVGQQAETILRDFHNNQEARSLEAAKAVVTMSIEVMNAYISKQNAHIEVYKAEATVYSERIKGALANVELYKAQIEGVKVSADVQKVQVDIYTAQIGAVETLAKLYSTRLEGLKILQEIEALKIERFKVETEIYSAQVTAEKIKADIYGTKIEAERNKAITYGEQVKAYVAELDAKKTELQANVAVLQATATKNGIELDRYKSELGAYQVEVQTKAQQIGSVVSAYTAEVSAYTAENQAHESYYNIKIKEIDVAIQEAQFNLTKAVAEIEAATQGYVAIKELEIKGTEGIMSVSAQLAASALSAVHASANYGYSGNEGLNHSFSYSAGIQESHSIPHDPPQ